MKKITLSFIIVILLLVGTVAAAGPIYADRDVTEQDAGVFAIQKKWVEVRKVLNQGRQPRIPLCITLGDIQVFCITTRDLFMKTNFGLGIAAGCIRGLSCLFMCP